MLVYEFIPNGTLFELIHGKYSRITSISLDARLRIAQESAEAPAYLHSSASPPIVHGDVKSPNILLGDKYIAKVTDFGASRMLPKDEIQFMKMNILGVGTELFQDVAQLAKCCLSTTGGERTLTTEVAERLKAIRSTWREQLIESANGETVQYVRTKICHGMICPLFVLPDGLSYFHHGRSSEKDIVGTSILEVDDFSDAEEDWKDAGRSRWRVGLLETMKSSWKTTTFCLFVTCSLLKLG
uniref:Protein kinase domain-containing protein n=1 Tax=Oryza rufipogon TaxID=4529 RepID=A0A0E0MYG4_ORYRU